MTVRIAPCDWDHEAWVGPFYPEEMPDEWRLAFFCNEFDAVTVPEGRWRALSTAALASWCSECGPRMRFYLEREHTAPGDVGACEALGDCFGGFLGPDSGGMHVSRWGPESGDLRQLRAEIERLAGFGAEAVLIIEGDPPPLNLARAACEITRLLGITS